MQLLLSFILFCIINTPLLSAAVEDVVDLESRISGWYAEHKKAAPLSTKELRRPATFVGDLHRHLLEQDTEEGVDLYSRAILAVVGRGAGVGGLRLPRNDTDRSHLLTKEERAIVKPALIDAERLRRSWSGWEKDYFGSDDSYYAKAGSNEDAQSALARHSNVIKRESTHIWHLGHCINNHQNAVKEEYRPGLTDALIGFDLSETAMRHPKIYDVRVSSKTYSNFDIFNIAFYKPNSLNAILFSWDPAYRYIPLTYFVLHGLPNHSSDVVRQDFTPEVHRLAQTTPLFGLLRDSLAPTYSYKYEHLLPSATVLQLFLDQCLPGLEEASPEASPRLTPQNQKHMLELFANAGKQRYTDPAHTEILLDALTRFMEYYPACSLADIMESLTQGVSYKPSDKNDFYFRAMRIIYQKALGKYSLDKAALWESVHHIFDPKITITTDRRHLALKKELATDLLTKDCLDARQIGSFNWITSESQDSLPLLEKFKVLIKAMGNTDLIPLLRDKAIALYFKNLTKNELFIRGERGLLSERDAAGIIDGLKTFSTWPISDLNKLDSDLKATIRIIKTPAILLELIGNSECYNYKYLLIQRLIELNAWDAIMESLGLPSLNEKVFSHTLQLLHDYKRLNAERMIYLARHFTSFDEKRELSQKATDVTFSTHESKRFQELIQPIKARPTTPMDIE